VQRLRAVVLGRRPPVTSRFSVIRADISKPAHRARAWAVMVGTVAAKVAASAEQEARATNGVWWRAVAQSSRYRPPSVGVAQGRVHETARARCLAWLGPDGPSIHPPAGRRVWVGGPFLRHGGDSGGADRWRPLPTPPGQSAGKSCPGPTCGLVDDGHFQATGRWWPHLCCFARGSRKHHCASQLPAAGPAAGPCSVQSAPASRYFSAPHAVRKATR
jgi:hypothetical protein